MIQPVEVSTYLIRTIYGIVLLYFVTGGVGFYLINRKKPADVARKSYVKFFTYFAIINIIFLSIVIQPVVFRYLTLFIIGFGLYEIIRLFRRSGYRHLGFFVLSTIMFLLFSLGFYKFSGLPYGLMLYVFLVASIFDSFSQIAGQLWGRHKIMPRISPGKTIGGVLGGASIAVMSGFLLGGLYVMHTTDRLLLTTGIVLFAFLGDALASVYKRKYKVKDYSRLIPGHGGMLDRFDSLIVSGAWMSLYYFILQ